MVSSRGPREGKRSHHARRNLRLSRVGKDDGLSRRWRPEARQIARSPTATSRCPTSASTSSPRSSTRRRRPTPRSPSSTSAAAARAGGAFPPEVLQGMRNADVLVHVVRGFDNPSLSTPPDPRARRAGLRRRAAPARPRHAREAQRALQERGQEGPRGRREREDASSTSRRASRLRTLDLTEDELRALGPGIQLLSMQPLITLYNLSEEAWNDPTRRGAARDEARKSVGLQMAHLRLRSRPRSPRCQPRSRRSSSRASASASPRATSSSARPTACSTSSASSPPAPTSAAPGRSAAGRTRGEPQARCTATSSEASSAPRSTGRKT